MDDGRALRLCLFGAPGDTANLGVSALHESVVAGVAERRPDTRLTVFDNGFGARHDSVTVAERPFAYALRGARLSRRFHRPESLQQMQAAAAFGGRANPGTRAMAEADAVLDISGGDSFTDLYGHKRWQMIERAKRLALQLRRPLVLLPQTYGPFADPQARARAAEIVRRSATAWARDAHSFAALRDLAGGAFDPARHRVGVDVAFGLPLRPTAVPLGPVLDGWLAEERTGPLVGVNVSGLLYNDPAAEHRFGLTGDYRATVEELVRRLVDDGEARVVLVPHVVAPEGAVESDVAAARAVADRVGVADRVVVAPALRSPGEIKWLISRLDWFCGTRMHATIAALSSDVPAAAVAYSGKVQGVFETCGLGDGVADARALGAADVVAVLWRSFTARREVATRLAPAAAAVRARAAQQMDAIVGMCAGAPPAVPAGS